MPAALVTVEVALERLATELVPLAALGEPPKVKPAVDKVLLTGETDEVDTAVLVANSPGAGVDAGELAENMLAAEDAGVALVSQLTPTADTGLVEPRVMEGLLAAAWLGIVDVVVKTPTELTTPKTVTVES